MQLQFAGSWSGLARPVPACGAPGAATASVAAVTDLRTYAEAPDEQLLAWSAGGDRRAFDEMVGRYGLMALRVARKLVADPELAEDIVQEALVRAWTRADRFDARRARFSTWLYRIVVNLCIDHGRKARPERWAEDFDPPDPASGALEQMETAERRILLAQAMAELPARQRAAIVLVYDEELSGAQAAEALGGSPKAVERLLSRARDRLRARLRIDTNR